MIDEEFERKARESVSNFGKAIQKDHSDRVDSYRESVKKLLSTVKTIDEFIVKTAKKQRDAIAKTLPGEQ